MKSITAGKILISLVALWAALGSYIFDWNATHIFNEKWPPHAKFHNAQDMLLGTCLGITSLIVLWKPAGSLRPSLILSVALAAYYWITQVGALLFPGTALIDPEFALPGQPPVQLIVDVIALSVLAVAFWLESRKISGTGN